MHLFATGGEQSGCVHVWDTRMPQLFVCDLLYHKKQVNQIEWSPHDAGLLLSTSYDGKVFIWDHSKTGEEQARHDYEDGPPELLFPHEMHLENSIEDAAWSPYPDQSKFVASCDTEQLFQVWKMSEEALFNELDFIERVNMLNDNDVE